MVLCVILVQNLMQCTAQKGAAGVEQLLLIEMQKLVQPMTTLQFLMNAAQKQRSGTMGMFRSLLQRFLRLGLFGTCHRGSLVGASLHESSATRGFAVIGIEPTTRDPETKKAGSVVENMEAPSIMPSALHTPTYKGESTQRLGVVTCWTANVAASTRTDVKVTMDRVFPRETSSQVGTDASLYPTLPPTRMQEIKSLRAQSLPLSLLLTTTDTWTMESAVAGLTCTFLE